MSSAKTEAVLEGRTPSCGPQTMLDLKASGTTAAELPRTTAFTNLSMLFAGMLYSFVLFAFFVLLFDLLSSYDDLSISVFYQIFHFLLLHMNMLI